MKVTYARGTPIQYNRHSLVCVPGPLLAVASCCRVSIPNPAGDAEQPLSRGRDYLLQPAGDESARQLRIPTNLAVSEGESIRIERP